MTYSEGGTSGMFNARDRMLDTTAYTRTFFRSVSADEFSDILEDARVLGQQWLVEKLYAKKVIRNIVKKVVGRMDRAYLGEDRLDDYMHDAAVVLMQIAKQGRLDLSKTAGEIACYICLWIEQRIKRVVKKDLRWQSSLSETGDGPEISVLNADPDGACIFDRRSGYGRCGDCATDPDRDNTGVSGAGTRGCPSGPGKRNRAETSVMRRHDSYVSSLFYSRKTPAPAE